MIVARVCCAALLGLLLLAAVTLPQSARAFEPAVLESVVSVLPLWPGYGQGGQRGGHTQEPEGSAVAVAPGGLLATALHIVDRAVEITVRLPDGRLQAAELVGTDPATDLALLKIETPLPPLPWAPPPALGAPVCAVGNQFGLGLSVTCGVVSALHRTDVGFNPVEDFIQTDATTNPGASGGALVDAEGRLVGLLSAIFTKDSDADIGVNFAASAALVRRVVEDLAAQGRVTRPEAGLQLADLPRQVRFRETGALVLALDPDGPAARAGLRSHDLIVSLAGRPIRTARDAMTAIALQRPGARVPVTLRREGNQLELELSLEE